MSFDLIKIFHEMGVFARAVAVTLGVMAVASLAVFVERLWALGRARRRSARTVAAVATFLDSGAHQAALEALGRAPSSPLGALLGNGLRAYLRAFERWRPGIAEPAELARREMERKAEMLAAELRRGLSVLASVGSVAPFVGLLGTVVGIISAFQGIAREGSGGLGAVSAGIAEALVVTAFGLLVAIPAVLAFNVLEVRASALVRALDQARGELGDALEAAPRQTAQVARAPERAAGGGAAAVTAEAVTSEAAAGPAEGPLGAARNGSGAGAEARA